MGKISVGVFCLILAVIFGNAMVVSGQDEDETMSVPMGDILLEPPEGVEAKRPPVNFPHSTHFGFNCLTCHHKWEMDESIVSCTTSGCHDAVASPVKSGKGKVDEDQLINYYKTAFHKMCISCHREMKAQNKKLEMSGRVLKDKLPNVGPTGCNGCHVTDE
jgi:hypothetical protein